MIFDKKLFKFLIVGVLNTIVGSGIMFLLYNYFHFSYWIASSCNYLIGGGMSFILNKLFTFQNKNKSFLQVLSFIVNLAICYVVAYVLAKKLVFLLLPDFTEKVKSNIAMLLGMVLYTILNYLGQKFFVFKETENDK